MGSNPMAQKEILFMIRNVVNGYSLDILNILIFDQDIFTSFFPYIDLGKNHYANLIRLVLETLSRIFEIAHSVGSQEYYCYFEKLGGIDLLEELQEHKNYDVYELASHILMKYGEGEQISPVEKQKFQQGCTLAFQI